LIASLLGHDLAGRELFAANVALLLYQRLNEENVGGVSFLLHAAHFPVQEAIASGQSSKGLTGGL
jgi:hypothetical protein